MVGWELVSSLTAIAVMLSIGLVVLGASVTRKYNNRFTEGKWKELGNFMYLAMFSFLGKLVIDFLINILNAMFIEPPKSLIQFLWFAGIVFIILTGIFMIRISGVIRDLSKQYGFK